MNYNEYRINILCDRCKNDMHYSNSQYVCNSCNNSYSAHKNIYLIHGKIQKSGYQNRSFMMTTKNHFWYRYRQKILLEIIKKHFKDITRLKLLDMGCGDGNVLDYLKKEGIKNVAGCDISIDSTITSRLDIQLIQLDITKDYIKNSQFDVILLLDVIEHVKDDRSLLKIAKSLLKKNGLLIIMVPSPDYFYSDFDKFAGHYRRYSRRSLKDLIIKTDLKINRLTYFNTLILPAILARTAYYRSIKVPKARVDEQNLNLNPMINAAFWKVSLIEKFILHYINLIIGSSLLAICRK